ncbi:hypothetical protein BDA99DRAFT_534330 [Phascolomyces articulosus]|uniref:Uncharacterized protein n=1 Tax=Phascolomyces articulosus TaxID=60185 RepID=A0AAD5KIK1_9FUNG|nr:hypothetical protein BDA99DRAFT_534330 [Phascolomyces articulosus]
MVIYVLLLINSSIYRLFIEIMRNLILMKELKNGFVANRDYYYYFSFSMAVYLPPVIMTSSNLLTHQPMHSSYSYFQTTVDSQQFQTAKYSINGDYEFDIFLDSYFRLMECYI